MKKTTAAVFTNQSPLTARIKEISLRGVVKVKFFDLIKIPANYTLFNQEIMSIKVVSTNLMAENKTLEGWNVIKMTS